MKVARAGLWSTGGTPFSLLDVLYFLEQDGTLRS
jgi:hypothetical protein